MGPHDPARVLVERGESLCGRRVAVGLDTGEADRTLDPFDVDVLLPLCERRIEDADCCRNNPCDDRVAQQDADPASGCSVPLTSQITSDG